MIYPDTFENKIGFNEVRALLKDKCLSTLGQQLVETMDMSTDVSKINQQLNQTREFKSLQEQSDDMPLQYFFDMRQVLARLRIEGTHCEEQELFDLMRSLDTIHRLANFLNRCTESEGGEQTNVQSTSVYPALSQLTEGIITFPDIVRRIGQILNKFGRIKDSASPELQRIRHELSRTEGSISRILSSILRSAQQEGLVEKDVTPTLREGRLVIPVLPSMKRKISGIVHDESASGRTVYIEPTEVVEANNRIRELEADERREIIRILTEIAKDIRPNIEEMAKSYRLIADIDFVRAKAEMAKSMQAIEPTLQPVPTVDWAQAVHPLLKMSLERQAKRVVPLDIILNSEKPILIISGPNAGGKSVCLKTVALLQYMVQCGLSIPVAEASVVGTFQNIMLDIGDEQSIENDLSTYSSHLLNMKQMMKHANKKTLLLIDEFGTGTEPIIGGAIAQAVLEKLCNNGAFGVITTHYQNLKRFADTHTGVANGAMLYDRQQMKPLFSLSIGQPGSSFAIEIARKTGLPEEVIAKASEIAGEDYIQSDKYLQDIVRDKRYWENKRQNIHRKEKEIQSLAEKYERYMAEISSKRKEIIAKAKEQAEELLKQSNRKIETTIKEIREAQAEKVKTKQIREELNDFRNTVAKANADEEDKIIARKIEQIKNRKQRHEQRQKEKAEKQRAAAQQIKLSTENKQNANNNINAGDSVRMKGMSAIGIVETITGKTATVIFGDVRTRTDIDRIERVSEAEKETSQRKNVSRTTRQTIDEHKNNFRHELDVRGERGDEALNAVMHFIDDAILVGTPTVRILHGKGNGILRQLIRQYLSTVPAVSAFRDEHVQFGGAGITVVEL